MKYRGADAPVTEAEGIELALGLIDAIAKGRRGLTDPTQQSVARRASYDAMSALVAVLTVAETKGTPAAMLRYLRLAVKARMDDR